jgi:serine protease Do
LKSVKFTYKMNGVVQNLPRFNKNILWVATVFLAALTGVIIGLSYPSWFEKLPFKDSIPEFLHPPQASFETVQSDGQKVIRTVEESAVIDAVNKASSAVVSIVASSAFPDPVEGVTGGQQGIGTGFIVRNDGIILTASHVVENRSITYKVLTNDKKTYTVKKIDRDPAVDFAILKVEAKDLKTLDFADSEALQVGQKVIAIGNALGQFNNSVTVGVISGIGRGVTPANSAGISQGTLENVIQTDAALNPGNSGGPLLDLSANVVGINFATTVGAENIGFVIPINSIRSVLDQYYALGRIVRPFLGISYVMVDQSTALLQDLPQGAFVRGVVSGSPAENANMESGDILTKFGKYELKDGTTLAGVIGKYKVGESVNLEIWRDGETIKVKAKLAEAP